MTRPRRTRKRLYLIFVGSNADRYSRRAPLRHYWAVSQSLQFARLLVRDRAKYVIRHATQYEQLVLSIAEMFGGLNSNAPGIAGMTAWLPTIEKIQVRLRAAGIREEYKL